MSDHKGARLILDALPPAQSLIADRGYDSNWFRQALIDRGTIPCIPPTKCRKTPIPDDKTLYRQRHKVENMAPPRSTAFAIAYFARPPIAGRLLAPSAGGGGRQPSTGNA
jgi:hypothetical protein